MNDNELKVIDEMEASGGAFVKALAECFRHSDHINFNKLRNTFSEYWEEYRIKAKVETGETGEAPREAKADKKEKNGETSEKS